jgi:hypothetical protein
MSDLCPRLLTDGQPFRTSSSHYAYTKIQLNSAFNYSPKIRWRVAQICASSFAREGICGDDFYVTRLLSSGAIKSNKA